MKNVASIACFALSLAACTSDESAPPSQSLAGAQLDVPSAEEAANAASTSNDPSAPSSGGAGGAGGAGGSSGGSTNQEGSPQKPDDTKTCPAGHWCSAYYPPGWTPDAPADAEGRFLHDFSYAGYHAGDAPPASPPGATYDVVAQYGADPSGSADATSAVQSAIDAAGNAGGGVVFFPSGTYAISGTLSVTKSGVVLRGVGKASYLRFKKATGLGYGANLTFSGSVARDAARPLVVDGEERSHEVVVADATGIAPGDHVAVGWTITGAFIADHGMTGTWTTFANSYQVFFRAKVTAVANGHVTLDVPLRYRARMRDGAALQKESGYLAEVGMEHLAVSNATSMSNAWGENQAHVVALEGVRDAWIDDVHSVVESTAAPYHLRSSGVYIENSKRVSVLHSSMENAQNRGEGGNGYLFEISRTNDVLFADTEARNGRHGFIQNWGFGNVGTVYLRCVSAGSMETTSSSPGSGSSSFSEHHHSLSMATLVDDSRLDDGFALRNRGAWSSGAGHTATESVFWRASGTGRVVSKQFGWGYVIGTQKGVRIDNAMDATFAAGTAPQDVVEGADNGDTLYPPSLYEHQRTRRLAASSK